MAARAISSASRMSSRNPDSPSDPRAETASAEAVRRDLLRTGTALGVVLLIVLVLALVTGITGARATRHLRRAEAAEAASQERLWNAYIAQARATRLNVSAGRRDTALAAVSNAAAIRPASVLRSEAIASLALTDLRRDGEVARLPMGSEQAEMDAALERFALGNARGEVHVHRMLDGDRLLALEARDAGPGTRLGVRSVGFSPDGTKLAARYAGGAVVVWELATRERLLTAGAEATNQVIAGMSFPPDSSQFMFSDPDRAGHITIFDFAGQRRVPTEIRVGARAFRFRPGREQVAVVQENRVDLMEVATPQVARALEHFTRVFHLAWSQDGAQLLVSCEDGDVYLWDIERGNYRLLRGHSEPCVRLGFSPDGSLCFTGSRDGTTRLWDASSGQLMLVAEDGVGHVFSPDSQRLGYWRLATGLGVWRVERSDSYFGLICPKADGAFVSLDLAPDGRWCVATQTRGMRVWDLAAGNHEAFFTIPGLHSARVAPDGKSFFICATNGLERWPIQDGAEVAGSLAFAAPEPIPLPDGVGARNISLSADGATAAVETTDLRLLVLDLTGRRAPVVFPERWRGPNLKGAASATGPGRFGISPDGRWVVTGYWFGPRDTPRVWDAGTGEVVASLRADSSLVAFSPDGRWLGTAGVGEFQVYATTNWTRVAKITRDEPSYTHGALAFLPGPGQVALTRTRQRVQLRAAFTNLAFLDLIAPVPQSVSSIRLSHDGRVLATASARDVVQVWRLDRLRERLATMNLDWRQPRHEPPAADGPAPAAAFNTNAFLLVGMTGFAIVAALSLFTLGRHRRAMRNFLTAQTVAAQRTRELEGARMELTHSQKMQALGTLAAGIAHDFNNLLSVIRMSAKLIGRETPDNPEVREHVADIEQAVLQGKSVVGSMLGSARAETAEGGPTDVGEVVEETVSLLSREFLSGLALTLEIDPAAPVVSVSRGRLEQMLLNLLVNASEAMRGKGKLKVAVRLRPGLPTHPCVLRPAPAERYVELAVQDSGPGIAPEIRERLFEPFFTTKRLGARPGTGLGLSLVYSVAQQAQLGLGVESEPGRGATFRLLIPVRQTHSSSPPPPA